MATNIVHFISGSQFHDGDSSQTDVSIKIEGYPVAECGSGIDNHHQLFSKSKISILRKFSKFMSDILNLHCGLQFY